MRKFTCFLFENFDPDREAENPTNPRRVLNASADAVLSRVAEFPPLGCPADGLRREFGSGVERLIAAGALREEQGYLSYDTPVFLREDVPALEAFFSRAAAPLADRLWEIREALWAAARAVENGFDPRRNLYHILCGMILDGGFFDALQRREAVAVARDHPSGLNYLSVIYQEDDALSAFSDGLLCSYNRFTDGETSLESFGDGDGDRFDLYRCFRLREQGPLPERFRQAGTLLDRLPRGREREVLLDGARALLRGEGCGGDCLALLELFGYARAGKIAVPIFSQADQAAIAAIGALVEDCLCAPVEAALKKAVETLPLTALRHGAPKKEVANELYHILFGGINEAMVRRGLVAAPPKRPGEGRFLSCIQSEKSAPNQRVRGGFSLIKAAFPIGLLTAGSCPG